MKNVFDNHTDYYLSWNNLTLFHLLHPSNTCVLKNCHYSVLTSLDLFQKKPLRDEFIPVLSLVNYWTRWRELMGRLVWKDLLFNWREGGKESDRLSVLGWLESLTPCQKVRDLTCGKYTLSGRQGTITISLQIMRIFGKYSEKSQ